MYEENLRRNIRSICNCAWNSCMKNLRVCIIFVHKLIVVCVTKQCGKVNYNPLFLYFKSINSSLVSQNDYHLFLSNVPSLTRKLRCVAWLCLVQCTLSRRTEEGHRRCLRLISNLQCASALCLLFSLETLQSNLNCSRTERERMRGQRSEELAEKLW